MCLPSKLELYFNLYSPRDQETLASCCVSLVLFNYQRIVYVYVPGRFGVRAHPNVYRFCAACATLPTALRACSGCLWFCCCCCVCDLSCLEQNKPAWIRIRFRAHPNFHRCCAACECGWLFVGGCSFGGLGGCSCRVCVCRGCCSLLVCVCDLLICLSSLSQLLRCLRDAPDGSARVLWLSDWSAFCLNCLSGGKTSADDQKAIAAAQVLYPSIYVYR